MDPENGDDDLDLGGENFDEDFDQDLGNVEPVEQDPALPLQGEDGDDLGETPQQERQPSRAEKRVQAAIREAREAEERARQLEERLRTIETSTTRASDEGREQERIAQMDPLERAEYLAQRAETRTQQMVNGLRQEMADQNDKATFAAECASNPRLAKYKDEVEKRLADARKNGITLPRRTLAAYIIGEKVLTEAPKARVAAERKAAGNLSRERARPTGGGSDAPATRSRDEVSARRARLENASI